MEGNEKKGKKGKGVCLSGVFVAIVCVCVLMYFLFSGDGSFSRRELHVSLAFDKFDEDGR